MTQAYPPVEPMTFVPKRQVWWVDVAGDRREISASWPSEVVLDLAVHPSGEISLVTAEMEEAENGYQDAWTVMHRLAPDGQELTGVRQRLGRILEPIPQATTVDRARLVVDGEDADVVALRDDQAVSVQRLVRTPEGVAAGPERKVLAAPRFTMLGFGIAGGGLQRTVFGESNGAFVTEAVRLASGALAIAMAPDRGLHQIEVASTPDDGIMPVATLVFITSDDTATWHQVEIVSDHDGMSPIRGPLVTGLTAVGDVAVVAGRTHMGEGDRAYAASMAWSHRDGTGQGHRAVATAPAGVLLTIAADRGGRLLVGGSEGYGQNPQGASVTTARRGFAALLAGDGSRLASCLVPQGPRGNDVRGVAWAGADTALVTGSTNAPGTHDADVSADGYVAVFSF